MSESRRIKRYLLRKGERRDEHQVYADNLGNEYEYKWVARLASFYNLTMGCFRNGFPILIHNMRYNAWAFYPFFFVKKNLKLKDPIPLLNHERIHVRQQWDIHLVISLPLLVFCFIAECLGWFNPVSILVFLPFIPTFVYGFDMLRVYRSMVLKNEKITFQSVRANTAFEREAIMRAPNAEYLYERKFWAVLAYTGWKRFEKYGM